MESITYSSLLPLSLFFFVDAIIKEQRAREIFLLFLCLVLKQREEQISLAAISFFSILQMFLSPYSTEILQEGKLRYLQRGRRSPADG